MAMELSGSRVIARVMATASLGSALVLAGCSGVEESDVRDDADGEEEAQEAEIALDAELAEGRRLFDEELFGGNGRTCRTCHSKKTGTLNPRQVQDVYDEDPGDPLFLHDGSDDGLGGGSERIRQDATIRVRLRMPENVRLADDPTAISVLVRRGIPSTMNMPALDPVIMLDARGKSLTSQASGAVRGHAQATVFPTAAQIDLIVKFETTARRFFSSSALQDYAEGGPAPGLPTAVTPAQKRGKKWFVSAPVGPSLNQNSPRDGLCACCHSGPMLNETNQYLAALPPPLSAPQGARLHTVLVSELNFAGNPVHDFVVEDADGTPTTMSSPDPGNALVTGNFTSSLLVPGAVHATFKIPPLWGIKKTAPYLHDNSAATLMDAVEQHAELFARATDSCVDGDSPLILTDEDKADLVAFLKLL